MIRPDWLILRRLLLFVPLWLGVTLITFGMMQLTPGDPVVLLLGPQAQPERVAILRAELGLDEPLAIQYGRYLRRVLRGDLGQSLRGGAPVLNEIWYRLPSTLELAIAGGGVAIVGGVGVGVLAGIIRDPRIEAIFALLTAGALSVPIIWLAPLLIYFFGVKLQWVPITGSEGWQALVLPGLIIAIAPAAVLARLTYAGLLEAAQQPYAQTARAKGLREYVVTLRHLLPNALLPVVTETGLLVSALLTGAIFVEALFGRPGLGQLTVNAVLTRDYPLVRGIVLFIATVYLLLNLVVDVLYPLLAPRLRFQ